MLDRYNHDYASVSMYNIGFHCYHSFRRESDETESYHRVMMMSSYTDQLFRVIGIKLSFTGFESNYNKYVPCSHISFCYLIQ